MDPCDRNSLIIMNRFFTLLFAASCLTAVGQEVDGWCCDPESYFFEGVGCEVESPLDGFVDDPDCADWASECVDVAACNYAEWGACNYECEGCRIPTACNYNGSVLFGNIELCLFPNEYCQECGGNPANGQGFVTIQDSDNDGICDLDDPCVGGCLEGCESPGPEVEISLDGVELWCNNDLSFEDQVLSTLQICSSTPSDSLFVIATVLDEFVEAGQVYAEVIVGVFDLTQLTSTFLTELFPVQGFLENGECEILGCTSELACNFNSEANSDDGSCDLPGCGCDCEDNCLSGGTSIYFYPFEPCEYSWPPTEMWLGDEAYACLFSDSETGHFGDSCLMYLNGNLVFEGIPGDYYAQYGYGTLLTAPAPDNYPCSTDTLELKFPRPNNDTISLIGYWLPEDFWCDLSFIQGCTDPEAVNFSWEALCDNGSCVFEGCTDPLSCNFDSEANLDDGSCDYSCCPGPGCCSQGLFWDWELGQCFPTNPADINLDGCVQLNDLLDLLSAYGDCGAEESAWQCGDPLEYQGYDYETVQIGEQCWFAENLLSENYENGEAIPSNLHYSEWAYTTSGAVTVYGEGNSACSHLSPDGDACDEAWSLSEYGRLYNWYAVDDVRGLCPSGWHVPTDTEWFILTDHLGGELVAGTLMKTDYGWYEDGSGTNESGFSGLPGGYRTDTYVSLGYHDAAGVLGFWWSSSTDNNGSPWTRHLRYNQLWLNRGHSSKGYGMSVRCIRDTE